MTSRFLVILKAGGKIHMGGKLEFHATNGGWINLRELEAMPIPPPDTNYTSRSWPMSRVEGVWTIE